MIPGDDSDTAGGGSRERALSRPGGVLEPRVRGSKKSAVHAEAETGAGGASIIYSEVSLVYIRVGSFAEEIEAARWSGLPERAA